MLPFQEAHPTHYHDPPKKKNVCAAGLSPAMMATSFNWRHASDMPGIPPEDVSGIRRRVPTQPFKDSHQKETLRGQSGLRLQSLSDLPRRKIIQRDGV